MQLLIISFVAGILTVLTPCVLPLLPVIIGKSVADRPSKKKAILITSSLAISLIIFTLILKATTALINISPDFWKAFSGGIVLIFGIITLFPNLWTKASTKFRLENKSAQILYNSANSKRGALGDILVGMSLGPVFSSCSPTYAIILATVLPQSFSKGFVYLVVYAVGLSATLLVLSIVGQKAVSKLKWAVNPNGVFKKVLGIIFILVGLAIITGYEKKIETAILDNGFVDFTKLELLILENMKNEKTVEKNEIVTPITDTTKSVHLNVENPTDAPELRGIAYWINSEGETLENLKGKVVVIDFWTYSCINCIRTLPYLRAWHEKYADDGLVILGIHAPEFAFEQELKNVEKAVNEFELKYPIGLDNNFETWRAYNNRYWPAKYFMDRKGKLRHYHFGEGAYEESEKIIQFLLSEDGTDIKEEIASEKKEPTTDFRRFQTPETYLGYERAANFANEKEFVQNKEVSYTASETLGTHQWTLGGNWQMDEKDLISKENGATLKINFSAKEVFLVMGSGSSALVSVTVNGEPITPTYLGGMDVNENGETEVTFNKLYKLVKSEKFLQNAQLELTFPANVTLNAFTFGS